MADEENPSVINDDLFMRRILGCVSYYSISGSDLFPTVLPSVKREMNMTDSQFKAYVEQRNYELKQDMNKKEEKDYLQKIHLFIVLLQELFVILHFLKILKEFIPKTLRNI